MTPTRAALSGPGVRVLRRGAGRKADLLVVGDGDGARVVKDFSGRGAFGRRFGAWLVGRELRAYAQLQDHPAVPSGAERIDDHAFSVAFRPGEIMGPGLAGKVPDRFADDLLAAVREMHARGVVHLDLRHRSNVLASEGGRPVLIDFASALRFRPGGWAHRLVLPLLGWIDERAVQKWRAQIGGALR